MGSIGTPEILLILVIALLLFGPKKLPEMGKTFAKMVREFRGATNELKNTLEREVDELKYLEKDAGKAILGDLDAPSPYLESPPAPGERKHSPSPPGPDPYDEMDAAESEDPKVQPEKPE